MHSWHFTVTLPVGDTRSLRALSCTASLPRCMHAQPVTRRVMQLMHNLCTQTADVVCATCAGAGDPRLAHFRFRKARLPILQHAQGWLQAPNAGTGLFRP